MTKVEDGTKVLNSVEQLEQELTSATNILLPLMTDYLRNVRGVRMAFGTEVQHIISHISQFKQLTELTKPLGELVAVIDQLSKLMTPEMAEMLRRINKEDR